MATKITKKISLYQNSNVAIFIDLQNLFYIPERIYNRRIDYQKLLHFLLKERILVRAIAYLVNLKNIDQQGFIAKLNECGYQTKLKSSKLTGLSDNQGREIIKANWDMGLAIDAVTVADRIDTAVLVSGDGDFEPLVRYLQSKGVKVEIAAFNQNCSNHLIQAGDDYFDLDLHKEEILFPQMTDVKNRKKPVVYS